MPITLRTNAMMVKNPATGSYDAFEGVVAPGVDELKTALGVVNVQSQVVQGEDVDTTLPESTWDNYGINVWTGGVDFQNPNSARLSNPHRFTSRFKGFRMNDGYKAYVYGWDQSCNFLGEYTGDGFAVNGGILVTEMDFTQYPGYFFRLLMKKTSEADITPAEGAANCVFTERSYEAEDDELLAGLISAGGVVELPRNAVLTISEPVQVDVSKVKVINGNNATIICCGDFEALHIEGTMTGSTDPRYNTEKQVKKECNTVIRDLRITGANEYIGTGMVLKYCFGTVIENVYCYLMKMGISIIRNNRNLVLKSCNIFAIQDYGVYFGDVCNLHQFNAFGNHISCCTRCVYYDDPTSIANHQWTGNDIETDIFPIGNTGERSTFYIERKKTNGQFSEMEISGNTIQGHGYGECIAIRSKPALDAVGDVSITGNHISNFGANAGIILDYVFGISVTGNTMKSYQNGWLVEIGHGAEIIVGNNTGYGVGGLISAQSCDIDTATVVGNAVKAITGTNIVDIRGSAKNVMIANNTLSGTNGVIKVTPSSVSKVAVINNIADGTYDLGESVTASGNI